jgi:hypothetical protein
MVKLMVEFLSPIRPRSFLILTPARPFSASPKLVLSHGVLPLLPDPRSFFSNSAARYHPQPLRRTMATEQHQLPPASQKLPAGLAGVMNPEENRDSAYYSSTDASSKRTSLPSLCSWTPC